MQMCLLMAVLIMPATDDSRDREEVQKIVNKAIRAAGGEARLSRIKAASGKIKGKFRPFLGDGPEYTYTCEFRVQPPDRLRRSIKLVQERDWFETVTCKESKPFVSVVRGEQGWFQDTDAAEERDKSWCEGQSEWLHTLLLTYRPSYLKDKTLKLSTAGKVRVGNCVAFGIRISHSKYPDVKLYYDQESGQLLKRETLEHVGLSVPDTPRSVIESFFSDYREVSGIKVPFRAISRLNGQKYGEHELTELKLCETTLDDKIFVMPGDSKLDGGLPRSKWRPAQPATGQATPPHPRE